MTLTHCWLQQVGIGRLGGSWKSTMAQVNNGKELEMRVAQAYRQLGARKVEHNVELAGNQIDVYVELETPGNLLHTIAVEVKDWSSPVGIDVVNDFGQIVKLLHSERVVDEGILVSSAGFSRPARNAAQVYGIRLLAPTDLETMAHEAVGPDGAHTAASPVTLPPAPCIAHPYPMQENFTGRVRERQLLTEWLSRDDRPVLALIAIGGMGKSALTWAWLQRDVLGQPLPGLAPDKPEAAKRCRVHAKKRPDGVLWWSFYEGEATFAEFLDNALAYAGDGTTHAADIPSTHDKVRALVSLLEKQRLLIVLDGFERALRAYASLSAAYQGDQVAEDSRDDYRACTDPHASDFLRWTAALPLKGRILLTSRLLPRELDGLAGCQREDLTGLAPEDAVAFFHAQGILGTRTEIQAASEPCGYHPLTLRLLAGLIVNDPDQPADISVATDYSPIDDLAPSEHHVLALAYESLDQPLRTLLSRLAAFRNPVDYQVAATLSPFENKRQLGIAFRELVNRGLIYFDEQGLRYDLHPIVRRYAYRHLVNKESTHDKLRSLLSTVPTPDTTEVEGVKDLEPVIELYHHTVRAGRYEDALDLYRERLANPLYYRLGAYQTEIDLLRALFDNEDPPALRWTPDTNGKRVALPRLREKRAQAWTLNALASSYSRSGRPRAAMPLLETHYALREKLRDKASLAAGLKNLASIRLELGNLADAADDLQRSIQWARESRENALKASAHQEMARLLSFEGEFDKADEHLDSATEILNKLGHVASVGRTWAYRAQRALLMDSPEKALDAAQFALQHAEEAASLPRFFHPVRDFVWANWLLGAAHLALGHGTKAEGHLSEALTGCRRINLVELEPDILLAWARWHRERGDQVQARESVEEALSIADRGPYRLKQAEAHRLWAEWLLEEGDKSEAIQHAETAMELAWCDGPPHCYRSAFDGATQLMRDAGSD